MIRLSHKLNVKRMHQSASRLVDGLSSSCSDLSSNSLANHISGACIYAFLSAVVTFKLCTNRISIRRLSVSLPSISSFTVFQYPGHTLSVRRLLIYSFIVVHLMHIHKGTILAPATLQFLPKAAPLSNLALPAVAIIAQLHRRVSKYMNASAL